MKNRLRSAVAFGAAVVVLAAAALSAAGPVGAFPASVDFPAFMHDAGHSGYSADATAIAPSTPLNLAWTFQEDHKKGFPPRFFATPLVISHVIYIGSNTGNFYAFDLATGTILWKEFLGVEPAVTCKQLGFLATAASGIDPTTGLLTIYAASGDGNIYALRASDGHILWTSPVNVPDPGTNDYFTYSSPEIANGKIYVGISSECDQPSSPITVRGGLAELDQATGSRLATYYTVPTGQIGGDVWSSPAVAADGSVFIATGDGFGDASTDTQAIVHLNGTTLARIDSWQIVPDKDNDFGGSPTIFNATINGVSTPMVGACNKDGYYYALRQSSLSAGPVWSVKISGKNATGNCLSTAVWNGTNLFVGGPTVIIKKVTYRGSMFKLDPATGKTIWKVGLPEALVQSPTMDGAGAIAAASYDLQSATNTAFLIDASTGAFRLVDDGSAPAASSPVFGDQSLVIATARGEILVYQAAP